jgi:hypothetical protein
MPTPRRSRTTAVWLLAAAALFASAPAPAAPDAWPARVRAIYDISFNGFNVGSFEFYSSTDASSYALNGSGRMSVLFGAFKWAATGSARGQHARHEVRPQSFGFEMKGSSRVGTTRIQFDRGAVAKVDMAPPPKVKHDTVPVQPHHLQGVLDPLSAVMALTRGGDNPCARRVPVYDGQRRIDIVLSAQGSVPLSIARPGDQPTTGLVCRITYKLVAGHRAGDETAYMTRNQHIEMVLRPVPGANVYVPYQVSAATLLGTIRIFAREVSIHRHDQREIVLVH